MAIPVLRTVKQLAKRHPALTEGGIRWDIFHADDNGLAESGAIIRHGRKVMLNEPLYFTWLTGEDCSPDAHTSPELNQPEVLKRIADKLSISPSEAQARINDAHTLLELATS